MEEGSMALVHLEMSWVTLVRWEAGSKALVRWEAGTTALVHLEMGYWEKGQTLERVMGSIKEA